MSKKLIAVASAAALALSALVATPASATAFAVTVTEAVSGSGSVATPYLVNVPTGDIVRGETVTTDTTAVKFVVTPTSNTNTISVAATGAVMLQTAADEALAKKASAGSKTLTGIGASYTFYAHTTSTTTGTVTVTEGGNTYVANVKGVSAKAYTISLTGPAIAAAGGSYRMVATVKDMFGNPTSGLTASSFTTTGAGSVGATITETAAETATGSGVYNLVAPTGSIATSGSGLITVTLAAGALWDENAVAFGDRTTAASLVVNASDPATSLAGANSQIAALTAQIKGMVTAKRFNKLARKWNAAFPSQKVALKK
jgi:hypothetical protein